MNELLTVRQAAKLLSVSASTVYTLSRSRKLPHYRIGVGRGTLRFKREDLDAYMSNCYHDAGTEDATPTDQPPPFRRKSRSLKRLRFLDDCV